MRLVWKKDGRMSSPCLLFEPLSRVAGMLASRHPSHPSAAKLSTKLFAASALDLQWESCPTFFPFRPNHRPASLSLLSTVGQDMGHGEASEDGRNDRPAELSFAKAISMVPAALLAPQPGPPFPRGTHFPLTF